MKFVRDYTPDEYAHGRVITNDYITSYLANDKIQLTGSFEKDLERSSPRNIFHIICNTLMRLITIIEEPVTLYYQSIQNQVKM